MTVSRQRMMIYIGFVVGLAAKFVTGSVFVFNVYQDAIKYHFNYTQTEVELLSSMLNVGLGLGFVPGMFYDKFGPTVTSGMGLVVSVPTYMLIWNTLDNVNFYKSRSWLMSIYFLLAGFGSVFTYMVALNTNVINFSAKHTGKIVGFLNAFFAGSPSVFGTLYYNVFTTGNETTIIENQNFQDFMLFFAVMYGVVNILCMLFLRIYKDPVLHDDVAIMSYKNNNDVVVDEIILAVSGKELNTVVNSGNDKTDGRQGINNIHDITDKDIEQAPMKLTQILCSMDFHLFVLMFAFSSSVGLIYTNNITVTSRSVGLASHNNNLVIIIPITNALVSAAVGIFSDKFKQRIPRLTIAIMACVSYVIATTIVVLLADKLESLIIATVVAGIGTGIIWSLCPAIMKEMFSVNNLGRNWGIALLVAALAAFVSQEVFGTLYDRNVSDGDAVYCYGLNCVQAGYGVFLAFAVISVGFGCIILARRRCDRCKPTH